MGQIAEKLGYQDEANFCRAFKRWTCQTPTKIRKIIQSDQYSI
ncbi:helix-turn-helix domain-containing protein [Acinetobacter sp. XH1639]